MGCMDGVLTAIASCCARGRRSNNMASTNPKQKTNVPTSRQGTTSIQPLDSNNPCGNVTASFGTRGERPTGLVNSISSDSSAKGSDPESPVKSNGKDGVKEPNSGSQSSKG